MGLITTSERMEPLKSGSGVFWEHVLRYHFACQFASGKKVIDIACGEGYGTNALRRVACSCIGVDQDAQTVAHAREKYGDGFFVGKAEEIPHETASVDLVVSFETIEHIASPERFVAEIDRVLKPGGEVIISTPNKTIYNFASARNPFHCSEMEKEAFVELLAHHFEVFQICGQTFRHHFDRLQHLLMPLSNTLARFVRMAFERTHMAAMSPLHVRDSLEKRIDALRKIPQTPCRLFQSHPLAVRQEVNWKRNPGAYVIVRARKC